ncbi:MAG: PASTA domain-containing protein [Clostridia bacterium]|nr:PASTA domain-containing protein [Clostridia bacterium]
MEKSFGKKMTRRLVFVTSILIFALLSVTFGRLAYIMLVKGDYYQSLASKQQLYDNLVTAPRGDIYDRNMKLLATSATAWTVYLTPNGIDTQNDEGKAETVRKAIASGLSEILELEYDDVYAKTKKSTYYVIVKQKIDKEVADRVREFLSSEANKDLQLTQYIGLDETTKRYYPNDTLASEVLGFVGADEQGLAGLEQYYENELTGVAGRVVAAKNARGTDMPFTYKKIEEAQPGHSLVTTVDSYIQHVCEKYLDQAIEVNQIKERGAAVVMNVKTGEIYGMAVSGDFNPNEPFTLSAEDQEKVDAETDEEKKEQLRKDLLNRQWRNKAVSDTYEPGSVFKIFTAATALEENLVDVNSSFSCNYVVNVAGQNYHCWKNGGHGVQNLKQAIANSCNPAFISIGQKIGVHSFYKYFKAFGLTQPTGIDLPGEATSFYHTEDRLGIIELSSSSFGQTFNITPLQTLSIAAAAVNGGYLVQPHIVSRIIGADKKVIRTISTEPKRQIISESTSATMRELLEFVVQNGAKNAIVPGYRVGGKTGTSQKVSQIEQTGNTHLYIASYVGIAPIDNPEIAVLIMLDEPQGAYYGGTIAAPVGAQIMGEVLPYLGYEPQYSDDEIARLAVLVPDVTKNTVNEAQATLSTKGLNYRIVGEGENVIRQLPESGSRVYKNGTVVLYTEKGGNETVKVPDFTGATITSANRLAADAGLNVAFAGNTQSAGLKVVRQSVAAGTSVNAGSVVTIYFLDESNVDYVEE